MVSRSHRCCKSLSRRLQATVAIPPVNGGSGPSMQDARPAILVTVSLAGGGRCRRLVRGFVVEAAIGCGHCVHAVYVRECDCRAAVPNDRLAWESRKGHSRASANAVGSPGGDKRPQRPRIENFSHAPHVGCDARQPARPWPPARHSGEPRCCWAGRTSPDLAGTPGYSGDGRETTRAAQSKVHRELRESGSFRPFARNPQFGVDSRLHERGESAKQQRVILNRRQTAHASDHKAI